MKTIIHIELSDLERSHLANALDDKVNSRMASRNEVSLVAVNNLNIKVLAGKALIGLVKNDSESDTFERSTTAEPSEVAGDGPESVGDNSVSGQSGNGYQGRLPTADELQRACERVLQHIELNEPTESISVSWCCSILMSTGLE